MIILNLRCEHNHPFEGWFSSSSDFASQQKNNFIACPVCGSTDTHKIDTATDNKANPNSFSAPELPVASKKLNSQETFAQLIDYVINPDDYLTDTPISDANGIINNTLEIQIILNNNASEEILSILSDHPAFTRIKFKYPGTLH